MKAETVPNNRRIYLVIQPMTGGMVRMRLSATPPSYGEPAAVLLSRGVLPLGADITLDVAGDPRSNPNLRGEQGLSAFQLARQEGYGGTLTQWLSTLIGAAGASAYDLARQAGYGGTQAQWIASLQGAAGASAYAIAQAEGFTGTKAQWLASLKGKDAGAYLGVVTVTQTTAALIAAGARRVSVTVPATLGVVAGDALTFCPTQAQAGYAVHDVVAVSATSLSFGVSGPLLAIGAAMPPISGKLFRLNA